jgi:hypothetical protein
VGGLDCLARAKIAIQFQAQATTPAPAKSAGEDVWKGVPDNEKIPFLKARGFFTAVRF